jgi:dihydroflavonol-4-reductase
VKVAVTGATGFVGAHVAKALAERGDEVRVTYRDPARLAALDGVPFRRCKADITDYGSLRRAFRGAEVVYHAAGFVASSPAERLWQLNAVAPVTAVEAAAAEGVRRVVVTSTISAIGVPSGRAPADETTVYPPNWLGLAYPDSKHVGEVGALAAGHRTDVDVIVVNPAYVLGVPVNQSQAGETSTRTVGQYLTGRLPAVVGSAMNFVDVEDVARGHVLAADHGRAGERYILGGENLAWADLVDWMADISGIRYPVVILPGSIGRLGRIREAAGLRGVLPAEAIDLMRRDWRYTSAKAEAELGYRSRPVHESLEETVRWYMALIDAGVFDHLKGSGLSRMADGVRVAGRLGLLAPARVGERLAGRRLVAGA